LTLPRLFRSTAFRTAINSAMLFAMAGTLLLGLLYYALTQEMMRPVSAEIETQSAQLGEIWIETGGQNFDAALRSRLVDSTDRSVALRDEEFLAVIGDGGEYLSGDLPFSDRKAFIGWREWTASNSNVVEGSDQPDAYPVIALGLHVPGATIITGRKLLGLGEAQEAFIRVLSIGLALICLLALALGWAMSRLAVRRIDDMVLATRRFADGDLATRLPVGRSGDDIDQLAENVNRMLVQTTDLMGSMKRISGGIAHELKAPLTRLQQKLELHARSGRISKTALSETLTEIDGLIALFNALLRITQIESRQRRSKFEMVDLSSVVSDVVAIHRPAAEERGQSLVQDIKSDIAVRGDEKLLKQLVSNILDNAIKHTRDGSAIAVILAEQSGSGPVLTISDNGEGLLAGERDTVFEPFHRLERSRDTPGTGLGLATVKAIASIHDAEITLADNYPGLAVGVIFENAKRTE
jgi:signal transduction histidine kinase